MAKDEATLEREKLEKLEKLRQEQSQMTYQDKNRIDDNQGSAYLVSQLDGGAEDGDEQQFYKKLLFTVPEHPKPKYLYYTSELQQFFIKQAEQLEQNPDQDNNFIFGELMKNQIIRTEFERIASSFGQEAFELNKIGLINFIKKGRQNYTYAVQYFGVDEGQIGILSRKVPYDSSYRRLQNTFRLPRLTHDIKIAQPKKDIYEQVEVEYSEEEEVNVEVDASSDEDFVPIVSKPKNSYDVVQGSITGAEYKNLRKDSKPLEEEQIQKPAIISISTETAKKKKIIKEKRRVKKKKTIRRLKEKRVESPPMDQELGISQSLYNMQSQSDASQLQNDIEVKSIQYLQSNQLSAESHQQKAFSESKKQSNSRSQPDIRVTNSRQKAEQSTMVFQERSNEELRSLENIVDESSPYMINFRELFKRVELSNIQDSKLPQPERYNQYLVHQYSLPKGLHGIKRQQVLSEAEQFDQERYSKKNVQLHMVDKGLSRMNLGGQTYGLKGSKVKPLYFQANPTMPSQKQSGYNSQNQKSMLNRNQSMSQTTTMDLHNYNQPILNAKYSLNIVNNRKPFNHNNLMLGSEDISVNQQYLIGNKMTQNADTSQLQSVDQGKASQRSHMPSESVQLNPIGNHQSQRSNGINANQDETEIKGSEISLNNINQSDHSMQHQAYQMYNIGKTNTEPLSINISNPQNEASSIIHSKNFTINQGSFPYDKVQNQSQSIKQNLSISNNKQSMATKKNNLIIKNLARNKKIVDQGQDEEMESNFQVNKPVGIFEKYTVPNQQMQRPLKSMQRNASDGALLKQQGYQIGNTMKISYLMDTKKMLNDGFKKKRTTAGGANQDSDSEEDNIIFNQQSKTVKQPIRIKESIQLPSIRSTQLSQNHPDTTGSQQEVSHKLVNQFQIQQELFLKMLNQRQSELRGNQSEMGSQL
ncbi:UNKNOWN [Stylonychia lemnae]|uniref:Uncharacterized protein n=1 Tax=Stylonychia lemnae TaxID=5949 RepID=A0A078A2V4_STYLE|nr:UNKNOWN [Stylonychia lemnae]|eukprot:CDW75104.1 UNKNOWN [Stylonychia lemnae]